MKSFMFFGSVNSIGIFFMLSVYEITLVVFKNSGLNKLLIDVGD